jgi:predicted Zn-dependent protease
VRGFPRPPFFLVHAHRRSFACWLLVACLCAGAAVSASPRSDDLAAKAARGKDAMAAGRFDEAAVLYAEIVKALPSEPGMLLNLGMALSMAGRPREAIPHLQAALKVRPDLFPASLFLGEARMALGQPAEAVEPLRRVVAAQPGNLQARQMLADALLSLARFEPAVRQFRELSELAPQSAPAWYGLGRSYEGVARVAFERLQRTAPDSAFILRLVAQAMAAEGKLDNAFRLYREALEKRPDLAEVHEALAEIYEQKDHPEWAAVEREKSRGIPAPDCRSPSLECDFRAGRYASVLAAAQPLGTAEGLYWLSRAANELARAALGRLDHLPPSPEASLLRAEILRSRRRLLGEAIEELKKAAAAWPEDLRIRRELASALFVANDAEAARPLLEDLLKREPDSAELAFLLGETWLRTLQPGKAVPLLERAVKRDPKLLPAQAALGRAYLEAGEMAKAVAPLQAALETDADGSLHFQLARAYRATGQADLASKALAQFQEMRKSAEAEAQSLREEFQILPPR